MLRGHQLGKGESPSAYGKNAARGREHLEQPAKGAIVLKDRLHATTIEIGGGLVDSPGAQNPNASALLVPHRVDEGKAGHGSDGVRTNGGNGACDGGGGRNAHGSQRPGSMKSLASHAASSPTP